MKSKEMARAMFKSQRQMTKQDLVIESKKPISGDHTTPSKGSTLKKKATIKFEDEKQQH